MGTTKAELREWFDRGVGQGATHMVIATDTFDYEDYWIYVGPTEDVHEVVRRTEAEPMTKVTEVYCLTMDREVQMAQHRAFNY